MDGGHEAAIVRPAVEGFGVRLLVLHRSGVHRAATSRSSVEYEAERCALRRDERNRRAALLTKPQLPDKPGRPQHPPHLVPRKPATALGLAMRNTRRVNGWTGKRTAAAFGCSPSHISRVESGSRPSRELVSFYEESFGADGLLLSLFEVVVHAAEQERRRAGGRRPEAAVRKAESAERSAAVSGDLTAYVSQSLPSGAMMKPGEVFEASWTIRNVGTVSWVGRRLERQGPLVGPGLIASARYVDIPDAMPGEETMIATTLKAPTYDCTSIAYFKMVDTGGRLCFPDNHQLGLDVVVLVRRNAAGRQ